MEGFYNLHKLTLNSDKTKFMIMCKPFSRNQTSKISLYTTQFVIEQSKKIKVQGVYLTSGLCNEATINNMVSKINFGLFMKYTNF